VKTINYKGFVGLKITFFMVKKAQDKNMFHWRSNYIWPSDDHIIILMSGNLSLRKYIYVCREMTFK